MPKYNVKNINIMHHNKLFKEGSVIELDDNEADQLSSYLEPVVNKKGSNGKNKAPATNIPNSNENSDKPNANTGESGNSEGDNNAQNT